MHAKERKKHGKIREYNINPWIIREFCLTSQGFEKKKERRIFYNVDKFDIIIDIRYELVLYNARDVLLLCSYKADETFVAECIPNLNIEYIYIFMEQFLEDWS